MKFRWSYFLFSFIMLIVGACQAVTPSRTEEMTEPVNTPLPTPVAGKSIMTGQVISSKDGKPFVNTPVRLAQVFRQGEEGAFALDLAHSPSSISDENGVFTILDIPPAEYLIVIGKPEDNNYVIYQDNNNKPITYQIEADRIFEVGILKADYIP